MFTINDDSIDKVDSLASSVQVNLGPIVFAWGGVCVARRGSWGDTGVPGICICIHVCVCSCICICVANRGATRVHGIRWFYPSEIVLNSSLVGGAEKDKIHSERDNVCVGVSVTSDT